MTDTAHIWDIQEGESTRAYAAFEFYRDMGVQRSLEKTRQKLGKNSAGYLRLLQSWSSEYNWVVRTVAWDAYQREIVDQMRVQQRQALIDEELNDYHLMRAAWLKKIEDITPTTEDLVIIARLRREIGDQGRRSVGLPLNVVQNQVANENGGPLTINFVWTDDSDNGGVSNGND